MRLRRAHTGVGASGTASRSVASAMPISRLRCSPCESWRRARRPWAAARPRRAPLGLLDDVGKAMVAQHVPAVPARLRGNAHVFQRARVRHDVGDLVGARDALLRNPVGRQPGDVVAAEENVAGGRRQHPRQAVEEGAFPAPFGPMMARISPRATGKLTLLNAARPPNRTVRPRCAARGHAAPGLGRGADIDRRFRRHLGRGELAGRREQRLLAGDGLA